MTNITNPLIQDFLNLLEEQERKLLTWGIVDGGFTEEELEDITSDFIDDNDRDIKTWDLINETLERRLLFNFNLRGRQLFRTRMSETVRLFARLRQLFLNNTWQTSPTLVADYRLQIRPRLYPKERLHQKQPSHN